MLLRRVARPLLAAMFVAGGINELRSPDYHRQPARWVRDTGARAIPAAASADELMLSQVDAAIKIGAGSLLALGRMPRACAAALAANLVPTTLAAHSFWQFTDESERTMQQIHFLKNCSMLGGLLLAAADTEGKPSAAWRAREVTREAGRTGKAARKAAARDRKALGRRARKAAAKEAKRSAKRAATAGERLSEARGAGQAGRAGAKLSRKAAKGGGKAAKRAKHARKSLAEAVPSGHA